VDKLCKCVNNTGSDVQYLPFEKSPFLLSADLTIQYVHVESKYVILWGLQDCKTPYYWQYIITQYDTIQYNTICFLYPKLLLFLRPYSCTFSVCFM